MMHDEGVLAFIQDRQPGLVLHENVAGCFEAVLSYFVLGNYVSIGGVYLTVLGLSEPTPCQPVTFRACHPWCGPINLHTWGLAYVQ